MLSARDVKEHLDHIKQQKTRGQENAHPAQQNQSSFLSSRDMSVSPENHYDKDELKYGPFCLERERLAHRMALLPEVASDFLPSGISRGYVDLESEGEEEQIETVQPSPERQLSPEKEFEIVHPPSSYDEENGFTHREQSDSSEEDEEPPRFRADEYAEPPARDEADAFDYGGFVETIIDEDSSSFGKYA
jgi:hypothetical protein